MPFVLPGWEILFLSPLTILYREILSFRRRKRLYIIVPRREFLLQKEGKKDLRRGVKNVLTIRFYKFFPLLAKN